MRFNEAIVRGDEAQQMGGRRVAVRTPGLGVVTADGELEALRMLTDRRDELAGPRVKAVNRLQRLISELIPGQPTLIRVLAGQGRSRRRVMRSPLVRCLRPGRVRRAGSR